MGTSDGNGVYLGAYETAYTTQEDVFADVHNLDHCIKYLNQSLVTFGFPSALNLLSADPASVVRTCNCIYAMLQQRQRDVEYRETAHDMRLRLMSDISRLENKVERLTEQLFGKERVLQALESKDQKMTAALKTQLEKLQQERDEFQRMVIGTQQVRAQQTHELKKKEKEYVKLQERLNQVLMEKKESKTGIEIMNLLQKEGRQRGTWNTKKADGDLYKMIVDAYEAQKQELVAENAELRALLRSMQVDMRDLLNTSVLSRSGSDLEPPSTFLGGCTDVFDLPFHIARDQIEQSLRAKMASIKECMVQLQEGKKEQTFSNSSDRALKLEAQLVEARSIISEQAILMSKHFYELEDNRTVVAEQEPQRDSMYTAVQKQMEEQITQVQPDQGAPTGIVPGLEEEEEEDQEMENAKKNSNVR
ncbi:hypothetical protein CY35_06G087800 [Sphagnum magellanicum]|nr:hypothetical protein CY35_06G087800 [Sphagnum magellanicum]KAH9560061.1 hypothetical protein CY35_06G087800 [Sphagnum magellanicum]KAH9560062.1 hypothetical protein CY35_06G087800 [Sphagnum magellanicum]